MKSIKKRLVKSFVSVIFISVLILEIILISFIKIYFYNNIEETLVSQIKTSADFYNRYFSSSTLEENILDNVDVFWSQTSAQVQIIDINGKVLMDSIGVGYDKPLESVDFKKALKGDESTWTGKASYDNYAVMSVSYPLKSGDKIVGVIRFVTSLREVNKDIGRVVHIFFLVGAIAILISVFISMLFAKSIIGPIKEVTAVAEEMAGGNLKIRSKNKFDDEIGKLSDTLNYMAEEIIEKDKLKNEFISSVSHELRTPLTAIKGWAIVLNSNSTIDEETMKEGLKIIEKESDRLSKMVEELLDFSKFVSGKMTLNKERIDIMEIVKYVETYMRPRALRENIEFIVKYDKDISFINVDRNRIKQVLLNILDNAFKFTSSGGCIKFSISREDEYACILVEDSGAGISPEDLPKVKEKFYKGKTSKSQNGIGLSICDEIIKIHEGIFNIESTLNEGTRVYVKLPI